jgi:hypothetical protein
MNLTLRIILSFFLLLLYSKASCITEKISYRGYTECYRIANDSAEVIIVAEAGGRVLAYKLLGINMIFENFNLDGKTIDNYPFDPDGGRFDYGPEGITSSIHDLTWIGAWTAEITGDFSVRLTSQDDPQLGLRSIREFVLDSISSHLLIRQTMINISQSSTDWFFWGRTLIPLGGKILIPLHNDSMYPYRWGKYVKNPWHFDYLNPSDDNVMLHDSILSYKAIATGKSGKFGVDADDGWMAYGYQGILFVKKFLYDPEGVYASDSAQTITWYTNGNTFSELEPYSPLALLQPGESYTFDEHWWLFSYSPAFNIDFDVKEAVTFIIQHTKMTTGPALSSKPIQKNIQVQKWNIYPNPTSDYLKIVLTDPLQEEINAEIFNLSGQLIKKIEYSDVLMEINELTLDINELPSGLYTVRLVLGNAYTRSKVFIK